MKSRSLSMILIYLLCALATASVALAPLPRTAWVLLALAGAGGALWDVKRLVRVPSALLTIVGACGFAVSLLPLHHETLGEQSLTALTFLLAIKVFGQKVRRDHLQILAVALMVIAGAASLEPDMIFGVLLITALVLAILLLLWLPFSEIADTIDAGLMRRLGLVGLGLVAATVPITALLFVLLPRSMSPFWAGLGGRQRQGVSGISDKLRLGEVSRVALSGETAFRAEIEGGGPLERTPYWRGAVLEVTDGRSWDISGRRLPGTTSSPGQSKRITYFVEPGNSRQLFLLETPAWATVGARTQSLGSSRVLQLPLPLARRLRYVGGSVPGDRFRERLLPEDRALNLRLPAALPESIRALSLATAGGDPDPARVAARLMAYFSSGFTYSLQIPVTSKDPLTAFLFDHRTGYCEYFASALAVMLRVNGVPARVVSGYLGGDYVADGGYYLVTQAAAHAWVEAYLDEAWVRFDPTPSSGEMGSTFAARQRARPRLWLDSMRMRWNSWVVQFDAESQYALAQSGASRVRMLRLDVRGSVRYFAAAFLVVAAILAAVAATRRQTNDPLAKRIARFESLAARVGAARQSFEGPLDHAERFALLAPRAGPAIRRFAELSAACRYGKKQADTGVLVALDALLDRLREDLRGGDNPSGR